MSQVIEGKLVSVECKIAIIVSRFNEFINNKLLDGAKDCLIRHEFDMNNVDIVWVPGSFEIPVTAQKLASSQKYEAIICLGTVIRGATPHFDYVSSEVSKVIASVSLKYNLPLIFGVLTTESIEQAVERAGTKIGNKGWDAALSALEMINLFRSI